VIRIGGHNFREVWAVDFEFAAPPGERPTVVCLVAWELSTGRKLRLWQDELQGMSLPPYPTDPQVLFIAYYASAELGCHLALGWPLPVNVLDLFTEFRNATNGLPLPCGAGLLGALAWYGLGGIEAAEKESMRELPQRRGPWSEGENRRCPTTANRMWRHWPDCFRKWMPDWMCPGPRYGAVT
jgi:hypothetical protein